MKKCKVCNNQSDDFGIGKSQKDGLNRLCRTCQRKRNHEYYLYKWSRRLHEVYHKQGGKELLRSKYKYNPFYFKLRRRAAHNKSISRKYNLREKFEPIDFLIILEHFEFKCFHCGADEVSHDLHVDHHMPRNLGHILTYNNAVILCETCNGHKNQKHPKDFYTKTELDILLEVYGVDSHT